MTALPVVPVVFIFLKYYMYYHKGWRDPEIQMHLILWIARVMLAPLLILATVKFWSEFSETLRLALKVFMGFILFLTLQVAISFLLSKMFLNTGDDRNWNLYNTIKNEALAMNILTYLLLVVLFYAWSYFERAATAKEKILALESTLSNSKSGNESMESHPQPKDLVIKNGAKTSLVPIHSVIYLQSDGPYVKIFSDHGKVHLLQRPLYQVEKELPHEFIRIHRSKVVRSSAIKEIKSLKNGDFIVLLWNGSEHRGSRTFKENLREALDPSRLMP